MRFLFHSLPINHFLGLTIALGLKTNLSEHLQHPFQIPKIDPGLKVSWLERTWFGSSQQLSGWGSLKRTNLWEGWLEPNTFWEGWLEQTKRWLEPTGLWLGFAQADCARCLYSVLLGLLSPFSCIPPFEPLPCHIVWASLPSQNHTYSSIKHSTNIPKIPSHSNLLHYKKTHHTWNPYVHITRFNKIEYINFKRVNQREEHINMHLWNQ